MCGNRSGDGGREMAEDVELVDITCEVKHETLRAYLIFDGDKEVWLPKSLTFISDGEATIPEWLAMEKGLI